MEATSYGASSKRKLLLARKDKAKDGKPVLKMRINEIPADKGTRVFETYTTDKGTYHYEVFSGFAGIIIDIYRGNKTIADEQIPYLFCEVISGGEQITFEVNRLDHRFSMNLMNRILNPQYQPGIPAEFSPYDMVKDGKQQLGIAVRQNGQIVPSPDKAYFDNLNRPQPDTWQARGGKTEYDFMPVGEWLLARCVEKISGFITAAYPKLDAANIDIPKGPPVPAQAPEADDDGLPF